MPCCRARLLALAIALLLAACAHPPQKAESCPEGAPPAFAVDFVSRPPGRDDSLSVAALSREGDLAFGRMALGLTEVRLAVKADMRAVNAPALTDGVCAYVGAVAFHVTHARRLVHVARELAGESCLHAAVLAHEMRHVALDDRLIPEEIGTLRARLPARFGDSASWGPDQAAADAALHRRVEDTLTALVAELDAARQAKHRRLIDTPAEEARMKAVCGGRLSQLHLAVE
jgi:hypothetical protein